MSSRDAANVVKSLALRNIYVKAQGGETSDECVFSSYGSFYIGISYFSVVPL